MAAARRHLKKGVCIRIAVGNALEPAQLPRLVNAMLELLHAAPKDVDIVIDLSNVANWIPSLIHATSILVIKALPHLTDYRTVAMAASTFPAPLPGKTNSVSMIPRTEFAAWRALLKKFEGASPPIVRMPSFGDYGIQHPEGVEGLDYRVIDPPAAVRYAVSDEWYIAKKQSIKKHGGAQFKQLAADLIASGQFYGEDHCKGCTGIKQCALGKLSAGSLGYWRRLGTTHHFTVVVEELQAMAAL